MTKTCTMCGETKELGAFGKHKQSKGGIRSYCKECHNKGNRERYQDPEVRKLKNEKQRAYDKVRFQDPGTRKRHGERVRRWQKENPDKQNSYAHARRARELNMYGGTPDHKRIAEHMKLLSQDPCLWCGETEGEFHWDHIVPLNNYGVHEWWNLVRSCSSCNLRKSDRIPPMVGRFDW